MQSYTFDELTDHARENAISNYYLDDEVMAFCDSHLDDGQPCLAWDALAHLDWRFNVYGERIA